MKSIKKSLAAMYIGNALVNPEKQKNAYLKKYGKDADHMLVEAFSGKGVVATPLKKCRDHNIRVYRPYGSSAR